MAAKRIGRFRYMEINPGAWFYSCDQMVEMGLAMVRNEQAMGVMYMETDPEIIVLNGQGWSLAHCAVMGRA